MHLSRRCCKLKLHSMEWQRRNGWVEGDWNAKTITEWYAVVAHIVSNVLKIVSLSQAGS